MESDGTHIYFTQGIQNVMRVLSEIDGRISQLNDCINSYKTDQNDVIHEILLHLKLIGTSTNTKSSSQIVHISSKSNKHSDTELSTRSAPGSLTLELQAKQEQKVIYSEMQDDSRPSTNDENNKSCEKLTTDDGHENAQCQTETITGVRKETSPCSPHESHLDFLYNAIDEQEQKGMINFDDYDLSGSTNEIEQILSKSFENHDVAEDNYQLSHGGQLENGNENALDCTLDEISSEDVQYANCLTPGNDENSTVSNDSNEIKEVPDEGDITDISKTEQKDLQSITDSNISEGVQKALDIADLPGTHSIKQAIESALQRSTNETEHVLNTSFENHDVAEDNYQLRHEGQLGNENENAPDCTLDEISSEDVQYANCLTPGNDENSTVSNDLNEIKEVPDDLDVTDISTIEQKDLQSITSSNISEGVQKVLDIADLPRTHSIKQAIESVLQNDKVYPRCNRGLDTVVCVDTSGSIDGKCFDQIKSTLYSFIDAVEENAVINGLEENISIVTFGAQTKVLQPLTNDYGILRDAVGSLHCSGTSPILTALLLCYLSIKKEGNAISICGYNVPARIILITDGRPTDDADMDNISLERAPKDPVIKKKIEALTQRLTLEGCQLFTVNTGRRSDKDFLQGLAKLSEGKCFCLEDMRYLSQYFLYQYLAGKVIKTCRENKYEDIYQDIITEEIRRHRCNHLGEEDKKNIKELIESSEELTYQEYPGLPHLGTRVVLHLSDFPSADTGRATVVQQRDSGWIKAKLDTQGYCHFHYETDKNNMTIIEEPLKIHPHQLSAVGVKVVSDNGMLGTVFEMTDVGLIRVAWDNGTRKRMHYSSVKLHESSISRPTS